MEKVLLGLCFLALGGLSLVLLATRLRHQTQQAQLQHLKTVSDILQSQLQSISSQVQLQLGKQTHDLTLAFDRLNGRVEEKLKEISGQVEKRLVEGFEKTTATFSDIVKRLALIDEAQKRISELSGNVLSLQELLSNKSSRGLLGEVQLQTLLRNVLPEQHFNLQATLTNQKRPDCLLLLPPPSGNLAIDAKFPLEAYRRLQLASHEREKKDAEQEFRRDIRKHLRDVAEKYILPPETAEGAIIFIPAESVFSEIHAHFPELVEESHRLRVWLASPTTLMAILTTARAVIKDAATRQQVHLIQEHLLRLAQDFSRFQTRMNQLENHIAKAHEDARQVNLSAKKITHRFEHIEQVRLEPEAQQTLGVPEEALEQPKSAWKAKLTLTPTPAPKRWPASLRSAKDLNNDRPWRPLRRRLEASPPKPRTFRQRSCLAKKPCKPGLR